MNVHNIASALVAQTSGPIRPTPMYPPSGLAHAVHVSQKYAATSSRVRLAGETRAERSYRGPISLDHQIAAIDIDGSPGDVG